ncbi:hypothetical protein P5V15_005889 [Pogonomyrmex californicus]
MHRARILRKVYQQIPQFADRTRRDIDQSISRDQSTQPIRMLIGRRPVYITTIQGRVGRVEDYVSSGIGLIIIARDITESRSEVPASHTISISGDIFGRRPPE